MSLSANEEQRAAAPDRHVPAPSPTADPGTDPALWWLARQARFEVVPSTNEDQFELCRWWTGGYADKIMIRDECDAELQRFSEIHRNHPVQGRLILRDRCPVVALPALVRAWGPPTTSSCPLVLARVDRTVAAPLPRCAEVSLGEGSA